MKKTKLSGSARITALVIFSVITVIPVLFTITNSFMSTSEITEYYQRMNEVGGKTVLHLIPDMFTFDEYYQILFRRPDYLMKFWTSILLTSTIVAGQVIISSITGYAFAKFHFPGRNTIFFIIIILMMMPYQVTLVSNYIVLDYMGLIGTYWALILPGIFSPFGVFLMRQIISTMPDEIIEAAKIDGANQFQILTKIVLPRSKSGIVSLIILSFIDYWNMVEQPLVFLKDQSQYPLSIFLAQISSSNLGVSFACGVLALIPVALLYLFFEDELVEGIAFSSLK